MSELFTRKDILFFLLLLQVMIVLFQLKYIFSNDDFLPTEDELEYIGDMESCEQLRNPAGCYNVGVYFYNLQKFLQADIYFQKACYGRHAQSCFLLAEDRNKKNNIMDAYYWALKAAYLGDSKATILQKELEPNLYFSIKQDITQRVQREHQKKTEIPVNQTIEKPKEEIPETVPESVSEPLTEPVTEPTQEPAPVPETSEKVPEEPAPQEPVTEEPVTESAPSAEEPSQNESAPASPEVKENEDLEEYPEEFNFGS